MSVALFLCVAVTTFSTAFSEQDDGLRSKLSDAYVPCEAEWYYFGEKCYRAWGREQKTSERLSWEKALESCRNYGGDLASIQSQDEQDFIVSFLQLDVRSSVWIGINDRVKETDFKWSDGSAAIYTNWNTGITGRSRKEDCVHLMFEPENGIIGKWNDKNCKTLETYICEKNASQSKRSPNPMFCSPEAVGGWKFENFCYHIVTEIQSWPTAEEYCKINYNGHLISISDMVEDTFLDYILEKENTWTDLWIGIKIQDQLQQKWSSGWFVSYDGFSKKQFNFMQGTCAARKNRKNWIKIHCAHRLSFICKVSKDNPPVLKLPSRDSHCPMENYWKDLGGEYCYYIEQEKSLNFYESLFDCKRRGGNLVSLHSKEESDALLPFVKYTRRSVFIGLLRRLVRDEEFVWTDGSSMDYENWSAGEPNSKQEKCVEAITHDHPNLKMFTWNDITCEVKRSYICSVRKISTNSTAVKENSCTALPNSTLVEEDTSENSSVSSVPERDSHCPLENYWRDLEGEYCYYIEQEKSLNFYESLFDCKSRGGNLASLHSKEENDALLPFIKYPKRPLFIGLLRLLVRDEEFVWTDGSYMDYENWDNNEPNNKQEKCAEAIIRDYPKGKILMWNDITCEEKRGYICSVKKISPNSSSVKENNCTNMLNSTFVEEVTSGHAAFKALIGVFVFLFLMTILLSVAVQYFRPCGIGQRANNSVTSATYTSPSTNNPKNATMAKILLKAVKR